MDRATLSVIRTFPGGDAPDYTYYGPPALGDDTMVMPFRSGVSEWRGFLVYAVPEPGAAGVLSGLALAALAHRRSRA